jgi:cyclopropane fatty-acyl-phospholipid synthase-like methyltransferase
MKAPSAELTDRIQDYVRRHRGRLYAPILHPTFSHIPYKHGHERFDLIAPHLEFKNGTVLDIGGHFGYVAHRLEELGYKVTVVEKSPTCVYFMTEIRDLCDRTFEVIHDSIFNISTFQYDVVIAMNIFHHFMKTKDSFEKLDAFLGRLKCRMMIYQAHNPAESQMDGAFRNLAPEEAARFLSERLSLPRIVEIGSDRKRHKIFNLTIPRMFEPGSYRRRRKIFKLSE